MSINPLRMEIANSARAAGTERPNRAMSDYSAGERRYGLAQSRGPNTGKALDRSGYAERDMRTSARRDAMLRRLQAMQGENYGSPDAQRLLGR